MANFRSEDPAFRRASLFASLAVAGVAAAVYAAYYPFAVTAASASGVKIHQETTGYWANFTNALLEFFATGVSPVPKEQTLCIAGLLEKSVALLK